MAGLAAAHELRRSRGEWLAVTPRLRERARGDGGQAVQHAQPVGVTELVDGLRSK